MVLTSQEYVLKPVEKASSKIGGIHICIYIYIHIYSGPLL